MQEDAIGQVGLSARGRLVAIDPTGDGDDNPLRRVGDARLLAPVDQRMRRVKNEIDHAAVFDRLATEQTGIKFADLRADAWKRVERGEERI